MKATMKDTTADYLAQKVIALLEQESTPESGISMFDVIASIMLVLWCYLKIFEDKIDVPEQVTTFRKTFRNCLRAW